MGITKHTRSVMMSLLNFGSTAFLFYFFQCSRSPLHGTHLAVQADRNVCIVPLLNLLLYTLRV